MAQTRWTLTVNGQRHELDAAGDTPLLYILQNDLALKGPRFGCGLAQCGSCSVLLDDREVRACVTPVSAVAGRAITTLEGIPAWYARQQGPAPGAATCIRCSRRCWTSRRRNAATA